MAHRAYVEGQGIRVKATFKDDVGQEADPTTIKLGVKQATTNADYVYGAQGSPINRQSTGVFFVDQVLEPDGLWRFYWRGEGSVKAAGEVEVEVRPAGAPVS